MLVGVVIAAMLFMPALNFAPYLTFGRLRPLHTNAVIFAFCGNIIFAGTYHSMQRLLKTRLFSDTLSKIHFYGWQVMIVAAAVALVGGATQAKEYAELPWLLDIVVAVLWVTFAVNFFGTIAIRREEHLYVAIWFYIATIVAVAILHIGNSMAMPYSWLSAAETTSWRIPSTVKLKTPTFSRASRGPSSWTPEDSSSENRRRVWRMSSSSCARTFAMPKPASHREAAANAMAPTMLGVPPMWRSGLVVNRTESSVTHSTVPPPGM